MDRFKSLKLFRTYVGVLPGDLQPKHRFHLYYHYIEPCDVHVAFADLNDVKKMTDAVLEGHSWGGFSCAPNAPPPCPAHIQEYVHAMEARFASKEFVVNQTKLDRRCGPSLECAIYEGYVQKINLVFVRPMSVDSAMVRRITLMHDPQTQTLTWQHDSVSFMHEEKYARLVENCNIEHFLDLDNFLCKKSLFDVDSQEEERLFAAVRTYLTSPTDGLAALLLKQGSSVIPDWLDQKCVLAVDVYYRATKHRRQTYKRVNLEFSARELFDKDTIACAKLLTDENTQTEFDVKAFIAKDVVKVKITDTRRYDVMNLTANTTYNTITDNGRYAVCGLTNDIPKQEVAFTAADKSRIDFYLQGVSLIQ